MNFKVLKLVFLHNKTIHKHKDVGFLVANEHMAIRLMLFGDHTTILSPT